MSKTTITITTINVPVFLEDLGRNINDHGHDDVDILIIGDAKTPVEAAEYSAGIGRKYNIPIEFLNLEQQAAALSEHQALLDLFPINTPDRVMLGGMLSYLRGCDRLIAVDDDNFPQEFDFVGFHSITGTTAELQLIETESGWFNVHNALVESRDVPFYPRGFPWAHRNAGAAERSFKKKSYKVIANQGLVLGDPDIDAISRLFWPINATEMSSDFPNQFGLMPGTWSPFNYQNTSLSREMIPLYYRPLVARRNGDIWTAYLYNRLGEHFGDVITFGQPLAKQIRNPHDLWDDLELELINNIATDPLIEILRKINLTADNYFEALGELLDNSLAALAEREDLSKPVHAMLEGFFKEYQVWWKIVGEIIK